MRKRSDCARSAAEFAAAAWAGFQRLTSMLRNRFGACCVVITRSLVVCSLALLNTPAGQAQTPAVSGAPISQSDLIWINAGFFVAPLAPCDLPSRLSLKSGDEVDEIAEVARATSRAALWNTLREAVLGAAGAMKAGLSELDTAELGVQLKWDITRSEVLPKWIARIELANDAILKFECTTDEAALAQRRAWVRCRATAGHNRGGLAEDAPAAMDADLWLQKQVEDHEACVAWLKPLFENAADCPEEWAVMRSEFARTTSAFRSDLSRRSFAATTRKARERRDLDDEALRNALAASEASSRRWRQHNDQYLTQIESFALQANRVADAALIRCKFLHAENSLLFGERAIYAESLVAAAKYASAQDPARKDEFAAALLSVLREYARASAEAAQAIVTAERRSRVWRAGSRSADETILDVLARAQRAGEAREQLMKRQLLAVLQWLPEESDLEFGTTLRTLQAPENLGSMGEWRLIVDMSKLMMRRNPRDTPDAPEKP